MDLCQGARPSSATTTFVSTVVFTPIVVGCTVNDVVLDGAGWTSYASVPLRCACTAYALPVYSSPSSTPTPGGAKIDSTGASVAALLVLLMITTGVLSVIRECRSSHVLYGKHDVAVRVSLSLCVSLCSYNATW